MNDGLFDLNLPANFIAWSLSLSVAGILVEFLFSDWFPSKLSPTVSDFGNRTPFPELCF